MSQGLKKPTIDVIRAKCQMPDFMRNHDRITSNVLFLERKPIHDERQRHDGTIGLHVQTRGPRGVCQRFNPHRLAADHVSKQRQRTGHVSKQDPVHPPLNGMQCLRRFKSKKRASPLRAIGQHVHAPTEPRVKCLVSAFRSTAQAKNFRRLTNVFHERRGISFSQESSVPENGFAPFGRRQIAEKPGGFSQKAQCRFRRLIGKR